MRHGLDLIFWHRSDECLEFYKAVFAPQGENGKEEREEKTT